MKLKSGLITRRLLAELFLGFVVIHLAASAIWVIYTVNFLETAPEWLRREYLGRVTDSEWREAPYRAVTTALFESSHALAILGAFVWQVFLMFMVLRIVAAVKRKCTQG